MNASTRPRSHRRDTAPSGLMLDVANVETIEPVAERPRPELPPVHPEAVPSLHRHVPHVRRPSADQQLTRADLTVGFEPAPRRERPLPQAVSWTAEHGFAETAASTDEDADDGGRIGARLRYVPSAEPRHERPSRDLVDLVQRATGVDVGDAIIDRSPAVTQQADELGAVAFTERGTVHLPAELGDIGDPGVRGIAAHELTHVAQQRARRSDVTAEDSRDGRDMEAEARAVQQHASSGAVVPTVMRRIAHTSGPRPGVQRLAEHGATDESRRYAWQERNEEMSPSQSRSALGLFGGYSWRSGSAGDRALRREDEQWRHDFEIEHRDALVAKRNEHFAELIDRRLELKRARVPEDGRDEVQLSRREVIDARVQLDADMPFEFELPVHVDPYPGELPAADPDDEDEETDATTGPTTDAGGGGTATLRRAPVTGAAAGAAAAGAGGAPRVAGVRRPGAPSPPGGRGATGSTGAGSRFDWQQREPTDQQTVTAMFGGGLLGDLLGRAVGEETDDDRRAAEALHLPQLIEQRTARERELRHRSLHDKLRVRQTEARREEREAPTGPISLTGDEITAIREQIDQTMPLEFAVPTYLDPDTQITIDDEGQITDGRVEAEASTAEPGATAEDGVAPTGDAAPTETAGAATDAAPQAAPDAPPVDDDVAVDEPTGGAAGAPAVGGRSAVASLATAATLARTADAVLDDDDQPDTGSAATAVLSSASEYDIDVLSRRIWSRIRREMRTELLVDRERAGVLADHR